MEKSFGSRPVIKKNAFTKLKPSKLGLKRIMPKSKKADMASIMLSLLFGFMIITTLMALIPGFVDVVDMGQNSEGLNCRGYNDTLNPSLSYNATIGEKSTIGCLAVKLPIPYIILGTLIAVVTGILYGKFAGGGGQAYSPYG